MLFGCDLSEMTKPGHKKPAYSLNRHIMLEVARDSSVYFTVHTQTVHPYVCTIFCSLSGSQWIHIIMDVTVSVVFYWSLFIKNVNKIFFTNINICLIIINEYLSLI